MEAKKAWEEQASGKPVQFHLLKYTRFPNEIKVGNPHVYYVIYLYFVNNVVNYVG